MFCKDKANGLVTGTAAGLARYLGVNPLLVRAAFIFFTLWVGGGILAYIILWLLMPNEA